jgi:hypothetical protein
MSVTSWVSDPALTSRARPLPQPESVKKSSEGCLKRQHFNRQNARCSRLQRESDWPHYPREFARKERADGGAFGAQIARVFCVFYMYFCVFLVLSRVFLLPFPASSCVFPAVL